MTRNSNERGLIVLISTGKRGRGSQVFVKWTPCGEELALRDAVQQTVEERVSVLSTAAATPRDVEKFATKHRKSRRHGNWYDRTEALMRGIAGEIRRERAAYLQRAA